jgi:hypothetical protein
MKMIACFVAQKTLKYLLEVKTKNKLEGYKNELKEEVNKNKAKMFLLFDWHSVLKLTTSYLQLPLCRKPLPASDLQGFRRA